MSKNVKIPKDDFNFAFKESFPLEKRQIESAKILEKYPDKIPVIIEKATSEKDLAELEKKKFLIPQGFTFFDFKQLIRTKIKLEKDEAITIFFSDNKLYKNDISMAFIF